MGGVGAEGLLYQEGGAGQAVHGVAGRYREDVQLSSILGRVGSDMQAEFTGGWFGEET